MSHWHCQCAPQDTPSKLYDEILRCPHVLAIPLLRDRRVYIVSNLYHCSSLRPCWSGMGPDAVTGHSEECRPQQRQAFHHRCSAGTCIRFANKALAIKSVTCATAFRLHATPPEHDGTVHL